MSDEARRYTSTPSTSLVRFHGDVEDFEEDVPLASPPIAAPKQQSSFTQPASASAASSSPPLSNGLHHNSTASTNGDVRIDVRDAATTNASQAAGAQTQPTPTQQQQQPQQQKPQLQGPQKSVTIQAPNGNGASASGSPPVAASAPGLGERARSMSHWHDSRISVEMHLLIRIEDLMRLAPGAAAEKTQAAANQGGDGATDVAAPVDFDEDAEPDITLEHVLADVEYVLHTRIIGNANPVTQAAGGPNKAIVEEDEDGLAEEEEEEDEQHEAKNEKADHNNKTNGDEVAKVSPGLDENGMPVPLAAAPAAVVNAAVNSSSASVPFPPSSLASPYFSFVSLDLAICDDLVTTLCYHMRRAEKHWSIRPKPTPEAMKAMELFEGFFTYVYSFRCAVSARPVSYLRASIKVSRHLRSTDARHRSLVVRLLLLLVKECPRIEKWEDMVDADAQGKVKEMLQTREFRVLQRRLAGAAKFDREDSVSRQSSFVTSRNSDHSKNRDPTHPQHTSDVAQTFPRFFSTRYNTLLPPKGACFDIEPKRLIQMFRTDMKRGLEKDEIEERLKMYGENVLPTPRPRAFVLLLYDQLKDFIILVLLAASVVSAAIQDWESAGVLLFVVGVNVTIGLIQEYRSANALKALNKFAIPTATLIRGGEKSLEPASTLVPGDIVELEEGSSVPADLRLLEVSQLYTLEAILTGEPIPILKTTAAIKPRGRRYLPVGDRMNMAFMNTTVPKGRATGIVVNTGETTEVGRIYAALASSQEETTITPLQRKLGTLGKWLVLVSVLACAAVIGIGLGRGYGTDIIKIGISLAVSVIPEGLVTVVTLTMAIGTQRMAKKKAIARNLPAVETLGAITTICSDKTGTLTEGKMKTEAMWSVRNDQGKASGDTLQFITASKMKNEGTASPVPASSSSSSSAATAPPAVSVLLNQSTTITSVDAIPILLKWNLLNCSLNNNASVKLNEVFDENKKKSIEEVMVGDATEVALLRAAQQSLVPPTYWQQKFGLKRILEFAFDSDRKRMSVILELPAATGASAESFIGVQRPADATHILLVKGAPEAVLNKSVSFISSANAQGGVHTITRLSDDIEDSIELEGSTMASKGMRVLATAFKFLSEKQVAKFQADLAAANAAPAVPDAAAAPVPPASGPSGADLISFDAECELSFIGLNGIMDPPRVEVADAISTAHIAGIRVCMITGDHYDTALAIAKQIGIFSEARGDRAMNGDALAVLSEDQLSKLDPFPVVFSRVSPDNKLKLVKSLQKRGEICAMTGDGVNDSPAIKAADVGIAMGLGGTEVTRQAADIILSDDNFTTIVSSVGEGRRIYDNIVKFLVYLLTCNGAEVWVMLFAVILGMPVPFLSLMLLWANIFADIPPSLSLGLEEGEVDAMTRPPRPADQNILTLKVSGIIMFDSAWMAIMVLVNYYHCYHNRDEEENYAQTLAFELLATLHLVHSFEARSLTESMFRRDIFTSNPALGFSFILSMSFLIGGCYIPGLNHVLELEPLHALEWGIIAINIVVHIIVMETRKFVLRKIEEKQRKQAQMILGSQTAAVELQPINK